MLKAALNKNKAISLLILALVFSQGYAQYEIKKHTINSGGSILSKGEYELKSSIGQTDAHATIAGGDYSLNAGFRTENTDLIYKMELNKSRRLK